MPNWCTNIVTAVGDHDSINAAVTALSKPDSEDTHFDLCAAVPCPDRDIEGVDWLAWAIKSWGTKWNTDCGDPATIRTLADGTVEARWQFLSAWAPPHVAFLALAAQRNNLNWTLTYAEPGNCAYGYMTGDGRSQLHTDRPFVTIEAKNGEWVTASTVGTRGWAALDDQTPLVADAMACYGSAPGVWMPNTEDGAHLSGALWTPQPGFGDQGGRPGRGGCFYTATIDAQLDVVADVGITELISFWWNAEDWSPDWMPEWPGTLVAKLCTAAAERRPGVDARTVAELVVVAAATWSSNPDCTREAHQAFDIAEATIPEAGRSQALRLAGAMVGKADLGYVQAARLITTQAHTTTPRPITLPATPVTGKPRMHPRQRNR